MHQIASLLATVFNSDPCELKVSRGTLKSAFTNFRKTLIDADIVQISMLELEQRKCSGEQIT